MPRKLKTFITNLGFFEMAVAAPSMKAALEAWGMSHNAFQHGFARETDDSEIVKSTMANPGVVLKRAVGTLGEFQENAELPKVLPNIKPVAVSKPKPKLKEHQARKSDPTPRQDRVAIISFEKAKRKREEERAKQEARLAKDREARQRATDKAELALEDAREEHVSAIAAIARERSTLDHEEEKENKRWEAQRKRLEEAVNQSRK